MGHANFYSQKSLSPLCSLWLINSCTFVLIREIRGKIFLIFIVAIKNLPLCVFESLWLKFNPRNLSRRNFMRRRIRGFKFFFATLRENIFRH